MDATHHLPFDRTILADDHFRFRCHSGVSCFLTCCQNVDMLLYPYDIILLKQGLNLSTPEILEKYTVICAGSHPFFPGLKLNLIPNEQRDCPFLSASGCRIYSHRPSACRTYPLERGVERPGKDKAMQIHYFMTHHPYCKGHDEDYSYSLKQWEREQRLDECNFYNELWAEVDAFFASNPWEGEGFAGPRQKLAFMVCYNLDIFRDYVVEHNLLRVFQLDKYRRRRIQTDDGALLHFGFDWLLSLWSGQKRLIKK